MNNHQLLIIPPLIALCIFFTSILFADQLVIKLDKPPSDIPAVCGDSWQESDIQMTINSIPDVANCVFYLQDSQFAAAPAQLLLNLSTLGDIHQIEVDLYDFCDIGCTTAVLLNQSEIVSEVANQSSVQETLTLTNPNNLGVDQLKLQSKEAFFFEIRIDYTPN